MDKVWLSQHAKWEACVKMAEANPAIVFIAWFQQAKEGLASFFEERSIQAKLFKADELTGMDPNTMYIFVEHHPLISREQTLFEKLQLKEAPTLSSLDESIFSLFGGERLINMMNRLGMENDEIIGHAMITKAIQNAQRKISAKVIHEKPANSQEEWIKLNLKDSFN